MSSNDEARFSSGLFASRSKFIQSCLDLIFPPMCHGCGRVDTRWCDVCLDELSGITTQITTYYPQVLSGLCSTGQHTGKLQQAIQAFKFYDTQSLAIPLAKRLTDVLIQKEWTFDMILPVPLHSDRERNRGYNQAYLLSQQVGS